MNSFRIPSQYLPIGGLLVLALLFTLLGAVGMERFRYLGLAVAQGEWWRLFTAHLVHANLTHWCLNALGFVLAAILFARRLPAGYWLGFLIGGAAFISCAYLLLHTADSYYFGLSALFYGALMLGSLAAFRQEPWLAVFTAGFVLSRLLYPYLTDAPAFTARFFIDAPVAEESHLYGALWGLIYGLFYLAAKRSKQLRRSKELL